MRFVCVMALGGSGTRSRRRVTPPPLLPSHQHGADAAHTHADENVPSGRQHVSNGTGAPALVAAQVQPFHVDRNLANGSSVVAAQPKAHQLVEYPWGAVDAPL